MNLDDPPSPLPPTTMTNHPTTIDNQLAEAASNTLLLSTVQLQLPGPAWPTSWRWPTSCKRGGHYQEQVEEEKVWTAHPLLSLCTCPYFSTISKFTSLALPPPLPPFGVEQHPTMMSQGHAGSIDIQHLRVQSHQSSRNNFKI